ncbi:MAG: hypothetical protein LUH51_00310 [Firmicutes bacterium]|nr:hypothetical protein [Bacillota bacterium]
MRLCKPPKQQIENRPKSRFEGILSDNLQANIHENRLDCHSTAIQPIFIKALSFFVRDTAQVGNIPILPIPLLGKAQSVFGPMVGNVSFEGRSGLVFAPFGFGRDDSGSIERGITHIFLSRQLTDFRDCEMPRVLLNLPDALFPQSMTAKY